MSTTFTPEDSEPSPLLKWLLPALVISLAIHIAVIFWARQITVDRLSDGYYEKIVPRSFNVDRVEIDPKLLEAADEPEQAQPIVTTPVALSDDKPAFDQAMAEPLTQPAPAPNTTVPLLEEKPDLKSNALQEALQQPGSVVDPAEIDSIRKQLLQDSAASSNHPVIDLTTPAEDSVGGGGHKVPGFSNLDELLIQAGPLTMSTAPILMPSDLLFEYDQYLLMDGAISSLRKLGTLIQRNAKARFLIEGHTDSFGEDAYNLDLSKRRAESVKAWLVENMGIDPTRIETKGLGKNQLIAPATGSIAEQQINRRVEIVILSD